MDWTLADWPESILALLPDPLPAIPGGEIITSPGPGVFCDNAMDLPLEHWPKPTKEDKMEYLVGAMKSLHSVGIVGVNDAGVIPDDVELFNLYNLSPPTQSVMSNAG